ncbi:MAG: GTPase Era [Bacteroidales bacterium]|jgi:GTP-binding protein Era|nr:GTPase Era [Bacteroidales bacterium]
MENEHKSGFVNIIGKPNAGKSTLMNGLVGENLSIITSKAQTTRHRIMGIVNSDDFQIVYSDTPGIIQRPAYKLQESMMNFVEGAFIDADVFLLIIDVTDETKFDEKVIRRITNSEKPVIVIINKIDLIDEKKTETIVEHWAEIFPDSPIIPVSALHKFNLEPIIKIIVDKLPVSPPFFPKDDLTDKPTKFFVSEIIREKILMNYKQEIPYSCEVYVEEYKEENNIDKIRAIIYVARDSQKGIIIGKKAAAIKKLGIEARKDIEDFLQKRVHLELYVKVMKEWRNNEIMLRNFGYTQK